MTSTVYGSLGGLLEEGGARKDEALSRASVSVAQSPIEAVEGVPGSDAVKIVGDCAA